MGLFDKSHLLSTIYNLMVVAFKIISIGILRAAAHVSSNVENNSADNGLLIFQVGVPRFSVLRQRRWIGHEPRSTILNFEQKSQGTSFSECGTCRGLTLFNRSNDAELKSSRTNLF